MTHDFSQYVMVADPKECIRLCNEAAIMEKVAMQLDMISDVGGAVDEYQRAVAKIHEAAEVCPEGHPDCELLKLHACELLQRVDYLENLGDAQPAMPLEKHIHTVQLTLGLPDLLSRAFDVPWYSREEAKIMGAAAAMGAATGLLMLGPISGVAFGMATALATTREDETGLAARRVGDVGAQVFNRAIKLNKEHKISRHVRTIGRNVIEKTSTTTFHMLKSLACLKLAASLA